jgi:hypothetical protein
MSVAWHPHNHAVQNRTHSRRCPVRFAPAATDNSRLGTAAQGFEGPASFVYRQSSLQTRLLGFPSGCVLSKTVKPLAEEGDHGCAVARKSWGCPPIYRGSVVFSPSGHSLASRASEIALDSSVPKRGCCRQFGVGRRNLLLILGRCCQWRTMVNSWRLFSLRRSLRIAIGRLK